MIRHKVIHGDCIQIMKEIDSNSIDMILCDLPYGTTSCKWDTIIPLKPLWEQYKRILNKGAAIVLTSTQPFTTTLISSNIQNFRYCWVWNKRKPGAFNIGKWRPLQQTEDVCIFSYRRLTKYYPIMTNRDTLYTAKNYSTTKMYKTGFGKTIKDEEYTKYGKYPKNIIDISNANQKGKVHPTQKPIALFEYLIETYTVKNDLILDNCVGSGTSLIAAERKGRNSIGIEKLKECCEYAYEELKKETQQTKIGLKKSVIERVGF